MKTLIRIGLAAWLLASSLAHAQSHSGPAPDIGAGKKRAAVCFACHNADGISKIPGTPHLAGQERSYIENALRAYRDGQTRQNATMNAMAKPLTDRDIVNIAAYYSLQTRMNNGQTAAQALETIERIRPVGDAVVAASPVSEQAASGGSAQAAPARSGEAVYGATCMACHSTGAAGAPKMGDKAAWSPRIAQGSSTLLQHALQGFKGMPAKGGCTNCSDAEIKAAVEYLSAKAK
jgi:cytochrome c5